LHHIADLQCIEAAVAAIRQQHLQISQPAHWW
jgi:hypothetical protein